MIRQVWVQPWGRSEKENKNEIRKIVSRNCSSNLHSTTQPPRLNQHNCSALRNNPLSLKHPSISYTRSYYCSVSFTTPKFEQCCLYISVVQLFPAFIPEKGDILQFHSMANLGVISILPIACWACSAHPVDAVLKLLMKPRMFHQQKSQMINVQNYVISVNSTI